jgi:phospholipid N-methyltransferase
MLATFTNVAFKSIKTVGSVYPSSKFLVRKMIQQVDQNSSGVVIELGTGTGVITKEILLCLAVKAQLHSVELSEDFIAFTRAKQWAQDSRLVLYQDSAFNFMKQTKALTIKPNVIVSSLPLAILPKVDVMRMLVNCRSVLAENGTFIQYQYSPKSLGLLKRVFRKVIVGFEGRNFPPALVYTCYK